MAVTALMKQLGSIFSYILGDTFRFFLDKDNNPSHMFYPLCNVQSG